MKTQSVTFRLTAALLLIQLMGCEHIRGFTAGFGVDSPLTISLTISQSRQVAGLSESFEARLRALEEQHQVLLAERWRPWTRLVVRSWTRDAELSVRRKLLFELWDECLEPEQGSSDYDNLSAAYGQLGRRYIEGFIRIVAPAGSESGYSKAELVKLNERRESKQLFDPYR